MKYDFSDIPNDVLEDGINKWVKNERNRKILKRRLIDGLTFDELSNEFYLSKRQIIRVVIKSECKLFSKIK